MSKRRVTLRDIAEQTGTSVSTVSLALRDDPRISAPVRKQLQAVAEELGYRADLSGVMLRTNNPRIIGVVASLDQELHARYVAEISRQAAARGFEVIIENQSWRESSAEALVTLHQFRLHNAIVINPDSSLAESPMRELVKVVIAQACDLPEADLITSDNTPGMGQLAQHLHELGHRRIVYLDGPEGVSARQRRTSLLAAAAQHGLDAEVRPAGDNLDAGHQAIVDLLAEQYYKLPPNSAPVALLGGRTAVACYNDHCAGGALMALLRAGISVPRDVSLAGFDNSRISGSSAVNLTTVDRMPAEVARLALDCVTARAADENAKPQRLTTGTQLVARSTTAPAHFLDAPAPGS